MAARLVFITTSPRVAPGLLSLDAWEALRTGRVHVGSPTHPQLPHLTAAGIGYDVVSGLATDDLARHLVQRSAQGPVVWLAAPGGDDELARRLGEVVAHLPESGGDVPRVEVVAGSYDLPGARLLDLVRTMDTLRRECPWDRRQTHESLAAHLIEESYEALEAIETGDLASLREELGDVLLQVAFHARVAEERTDGTGFTVDDVAAGIVDKLVRRHPHVFGDVTVADADEVKANWDAIKVAERAEKNGGEASILDGVPFGQPALALAHQLQKRAARAGVPEDVIARHLEGLGGRLFALVAQARDAGEDAEAALRAAARAFRDRVRAVERAARASGREPRELTAQEWRDLWDQTGG